MKKLLLLFSAFLLTSSCANVDKLIDHGRYDEAIHKLVKKMAGKKSKKREDVLALEYAFQKAQDKDLQQEKALRDENLPENWTKIYSIHSRIADRQNRIEGLLPLESKDGYQARFKFINIAELQKESKRNTADFHYQTALRLIEEAKQSGDKAAAREAYSNLERIDALFGQYKEKDQLKKVALSLGTEHFLVKIKNNTMQIIPEYIEAEMLKLSVENLNTRFRNYDVRSNPSVYYDSYIILNLTQLEFSPEREKSRIYDDVHEIETEEVVMGPNNKPKRDSLGREIKQKVKTRYVSTIEEVTQLKTLLLGGRLEYTNVRSGDLEYSQPIQVEAVFENQTARLIKGDRDRVTDDCRRKLNGKIKPFPSNETLLLDAAEKMKSLVKQIIHDRAR